MLSSDFWVRNLLTHSPSPVPSCSSQSSEELVKPEPIRPMPAVDYMQLAQLQLLWQQPSMLQHLLSAYATALVEPAKPAALSPDLPPVSRKRLGSNASSERKCKVARLGDDKVTNSPVSGMFIKAAEELPSPAELQKQADELDETAAFVNVSEEARRQVALIPNLIGDCVCSLCKVKYDDVFRLAQHKCPRIAHEEYKCPECDKVFSCPANLASHRRWHRPREESVPACRRCQQAFPSKKQLKAHACPSDMAPLPLTQLFPTIAAHL